MRPGGWAQFKTALTSRPYWVGPGCLAGGPGRKERFPAELGEILALLPSKTGARSHAVASETEFASFGITA